MHCLKHMQVFTRRIRPFTRKACTARSKDIMRGSLRSNLIEARSLAVKEKVRPRMARKVTEI